MSPKKDPILIALVDCPERWNKFLLKHYGLPKEPQRRMEISETTFTEGCGAFEVAAGWLGARPDLSFPEPEPSEQWKRSQSFLRIMVLIYSCKNKLSDKERLALLKEVDDLAPMGPLPVFDNSLGSAEEFFERWKSHELDVRFVHNDQATPVFEIWRESIPPDQAEDRNEA